MSRRLFLYGTALFGAVLFLVSGCATPRTTMVGPARPAIAREDVRIYQAPPRRFERIAVIEGRSIEELRDRAAAVGANGLLPGGMVHKPGPSISVGVGGGSWGYGGGGGAVGANAFIPTGSTMMEAMAIYVP